MSKEKIIVALDVPTPAEAREMIARLSGEVGAFKIGLQLFTAAGARFVSEAVGAGNRIFLDLKFHDIPNTAAKASVEAARMGVWMFNLHALGGGEMMRRAAEETREFCARENLAQPKIIAVTVLTSSTDETLREVGVAEKAEAQVLKLARLAAASSLDGVVASPRETALLRGENESRDFLLVTPGVRPRAENSAGESGVPRDDQKRTMTPAGALRAGADYLVVGRPILQSADPVRAARQIVLDIERQSEHAADF